MEVLHHMVMEASEEMQSTGAVASVVEWNPDRHARGHYICGVTVGAAVETTKLRDSGRGHPSKKWVLTTPQFSPELEGH
jgi:hypothetical protein